MIIKELHDRPYNANQLAEKLGLDYKTVRHHLKVLLENNIIETNVGEKYGAMFFLSRSMESEYHLFLEIWNKIAPQREGAEREE